MGSAGRALDLGLLMRASSWIRIDTKQSITFSRFFVKKKKKTNSYGLTKVPVRTLLYSRPVDVRGSCKAAGGLSEGRPDGIDPLDGDFANPAHIAARSMSACSEGIIRLL